MNNFQRYIDAEYKLNEGLIRRDLSRERPEGYVKNPIDRMNTMAAFLKNCGNPQEGIPAIHVAGTSGKGSVCAAISGMLKSAGLKVGLHISPYLQSATEKIWIDGKYASAAFFSELVDWIMPRALPFLHPETPASIHGMASVAIAFEAFRRENVDVMIFEAGCGGRYDLTSFVDTEIAVITNIGLDHVVSLGPEISDIAWHKAGIIRPGKSVITGATGEALDVIEKEATAQSATLHKVEPAETVRKHNHMLASTAVTEFARSQRWTISPSVYKEETNAVALPGRFEKIEDTATVFLDGAHNADKLTAAVQYALAPKCAGPRIAVIGLLGTKANEQTVAPLTGKFDQIIATEPQVYGKTAFPAPQTAQLFTEEQRPPIVCHSPEKAISMALELAKNGSVLICGSFYLCGEVRERWYPREKVVLQQTSWPS